MRQSYWGGGADPTFGTLAQVWANDPLLVSYNAVNLLKRGAWLAQVVERATLDLGRLNLSLMLWGRDYVKR